MEKLNALLKSRKFWAAIAGLAASVTALAYGAITIDQGVQAIIATLAAYMIGTGLDNPTEIR